MQSVFLKCELTCCNMFDRNIKYIKNLNSTVLMKCTDILKEEKFTYLLDSIESSMECEDRVDELVVQ